MSIVVVIVVITSSPLSLVFSIVRSYSAFPSSLTLSPSFSPEVEVPVVSLDPLVDTLFSVVEPPELVSLLEVVVEVSAMTNAMSAKAIKRVENRMACCVLFCNKNKIKTTHRGSDTARVVHMVTLVTLRMTTVCQDARIVGTT